MSAPDRNWTARRANAGNSTYFPDRVVPMLPDTLSGDLLLFCTKAWTALALRWKCRLTPRATRPGTRFHRANDALCRKLDL